MVAAKDPQALGAGTFLSEKTMARQRSRMWWLKAGDDNSKLFHAVANRRRIRNFIPVVKHNGEIITDHTRKEEVFHETYNALLGSIQNRKITMELEHLGI